MEGGWEGVITTETKFIYFSECTRNNIFSTTSEIVIHENQSKLSPVRFLAVKDLLESFHMVRKLLHKLGIAGEAGEGEDIRPNVICDPVGGRVGQLLRNCCATGNQVAPLVLVCVCV